jgi:hypothetical protein
LVLGDRPGPHLHRFLRFPGLGAHMVLLIVGLAHSVTTPGDNGEAETGKSGEDQNGFARDFRQHAVAENAGPQMHDEVNR